MTEREGKEDDRGGTAEVRFGYFYFFSVFRVFVIVVRGFYNSLLLFPQRARNCLPSSLFFLSL